MKTALLILLLLIATVVLSDSAYADLRLRGQPFQVSTSTFGLQNDLATAPDGSFAIVWRTAINSQTEGSSEVHGRHYDSRAVPSGPEFTVDFSTRYTISNPSVDVASDGRFVVAWDKGGDVYAQRYDDTGVPVGSKFQINSYTPSGQEYPSVASGGSDNFVIVWTSEGQDGDKRGVFGQRFDSVGAPTGSEFPINTSTQGVQAWPTVSGTPDGAFVVAWTSIDDAANGDWNIKGRRYDSSGAPLGGEFPINTYTTGFQADPSVAIAADGSFVMTWSGAGQDSATITNVYGQRYDSSGFPSGPDFRINSDTTRGHTDAEVAIAPDGGFVVAWWSAAPAEDGSLEPPYEVLVRRFDATGAPMGLEAHVVPAERYPSSPVSMAVDGNGDVMVTWTQFSGDEISARWDVFAQILCEDGDADLVCDVCREDECASQPVAPGTTVSTDTEADGATPADPIETHITSPNAGSISISEIVASTSPPVFIVEISAPPASVLDPLIFGFRIDATLAASFQISRNGVFVSGTCTGAPGTADPDPCIAGAETLPDGDALVTVLTSAASRWRIEPLPCAPTPVAGCLAAGKASFQVKDDTDDAKDQLKWKFSKGDAFDQDDIGMLTSTRSYAVCIYDETADVASLVGYTRVAPGTHWIPKAPKGAKYVDKDGESDGVTKASFKTGSAGKTGVGVAAKGLNVAMPTPSSGTTFFNHGSAVIIQLVNNETTVCWSTEFPTASVIINDGARFKAKTP